MPDLVVVHWPHDGEWVVELGDRQLESGFDTEAEARAFAEGYLLAWGEARGAIGSMMRGGPDAPGVGIKTETRQPRNG